MAGEKALVDGKIAGKKVMVFSKRSCPYCKMAKAALNKYLGKELAEEDYEVLEIDGMDECSGIQDYLQKLTGARSVPRVFINQKFVGGGSEITAMDKSGELKKLLS